MEQQLLGPIGTEKYLDYIGGIRESGTHLLDLISDILDMSKIEAGKYELDLEEMNVMKSVKLSIHMMEGRAHESGVKVKFDGEANEALKIIADRRAVLQILLNLLSNAVKFSLEGGEVMVSCAEREDYIVLKVSDTGIGIPANKLAGITRPFEQVSSSYSRDHEGSGLGLAITKELAQLHGGMLSIESRVGEGTSVSVRMPCDASKFMAQA
jgi:two-component system cell cycle sensor histidine kinase PleC